MTVRVAEWVGAGPPVAVQSYDFGLWPALIVVGMLTGPAALGALVGWLANRGRAGATRLILGGAVGAAAGGATLAVILFLTVSIRPAAGLIILAYFLPSPVAAAVGFAVPFAASGRSDQD